MSADGGSDRRGEFALALLSIPIFFYGLGDYAAVNGDEAFYQTAAREMARTGEWWRVTAGGELQLYDVFMNSPVHYWARALLIRLFGDNYWTMRLIAATFGALTVLATNRLARRVSGSRAGILAGFALLTTFQFVYVHGARTGELDSIVAFVFVASAIQFVRALEEERRSFLPHHLCLLSLLVLKLPVIAMPLAAELAVLVAAGHSRRIREWALLLVGLSPLFLLWHVAQALAHWDGVVTVARTMLAEAAGPANGGGIGANARFYASTVLAAAYPWAAAYVPAALALAWRRDLLRQGAAIAVAHATAVVAFYLLVDKRYSWYLIPALPFLSIIVALWLERLLAGDGRITDVILASVAAVAVLAFPADWIALNPFAREELDRWLGEPHWPSSVGLWLLVAGIASGALALIARKREAALARIVAAALLGLCGVAGAAHVVLPLRMTDTRSALETLRDRLAESKATEGVVETPVPVASRFVRLGWYYFGDAYHVVPCPGTPWRFFVLVDRELPGAPEERIHCAELDPYADFR